MTVDDVLTLRDPGTGAVSAPPSGYTVDVTPYGTRVEGPGGERLLFARPDAPADPPGPPTADSPGDADGGPGRGGGTWTAEPASASTAPAHQVDVAIVDVGESAAVIGALRRAGVVSTTTAVLAVGGDHRVHSPAEFDRRARLWGASSPSDGQELWCPPSAWPPERAHGPHRVLITGGARSGKSAEAERRLLGEPDVTYLATGPSPSGDESWARRVADHRARRPWWWKTEETPDAAAVLRGSQGALLFDCVGTWLAAAMEHCGLWAESPPSGAEEELSARVGELVDAWRRCPAYVVAVTNEVGSGVVPATVSGGLFRDWLGRVNQLLAAESEEVVLATAGRVTELP
ncbi:bifunctional adenosylcobinamide kinase/adenosylcobinamide-phosphate guanylyltransferase [Streptomonospora litoralis]|uniref:bifunctional adenosylcobinamide kinase/adenosylcobinamide-phosphate guanylyltransferase n=1 Tax=Streptomonospora litoralis TaxID=2498135 RepID=UPI0010367B33|nr:bifunctional adenosylcobinamide kinase/adenosylcobinamide-phosphate guanylyltransferase [Streptomonospora litoralis]